jgi:hypothetical protein
MSPEEQRIEVELNIFSGRPNPKWSLSEVEVAALASKVATEAGFEVESSAAPQLGYRGIAIINSGRAPGLPDVIHAFGGVLTIVDGGETSYRADVNELEQWLLSQARERGFGEVIDDALRFRKGEAAR